jgi:DNA-binding transcriptional MerR regulator
LILSSAALAAPVKSPDAFRTISEVALELDVPQHVLRFWESRFAQIKPVKRAGGRRFYRPEDVDLLRGIRGLLYSDGLTIRGVQKILKERGLRHVAGIGRGATPEPVVVEKIVFVEKPVAEAAPTPVPVKKRAPHLRAVPSPMSLPFFDDEPVSVAEAKPAPVAEVKVAEIKPSMAAEERYKLKALLSELEGLKRRLKTARKHY